MEIKERVGIAVYLYYNRDARKLSKFGDVLYHSRRFNYLILYINRDDQKTVVSKLKQMKIIKKVKPSAFDDIDRSFVGNLGNHREESVI
ncbi:DUF2129 domain-containing protein [Streptococcus hyovaginalis]|uniref:DUF2129 domain-containing protein n=1 Tax=Streptococcus hyovaginalis TaxID=149015 RepID=UPI003AC98A16